MTSTNEGADPTTDLLLRPAHDEDADALAELFMEAREAAYPAMPRPVHPPHEIRKWFAQILGLAERTIPMPVARETWVAEREGALLGYLVLDPEWLDSLYVQPGLTGRGVGSALLDLAKGLRPDGFGLWVFESNVRARRFYERHGLVAVRRTDGSDNEEKTPDVEMLWPGRDPLTAVRRRIDDVDGRLAELLEERALLTAAAQRLKPVGGHAGRDPEREAEIVARMAARAPHLGPDALGRIMHAVIGVALDAADPEPAGESDQERAEPADGRA